MGFGKGTSTKAKNRLGHRSWFTQPPDGIKFDLKKDDGSVAEKQNFS